MNFPFFISLPLILHDLPGMKTGLIGYGKMGKALESVALDRGHSIAYIIDPEHPAVHDSPNLSEADVILEFTSPEDAFKNIIAGLKSGRPVVSGTTGWTRRLQEAVDYCRKVDGGFFYASNFSLGTNLFLALNRKLASLMASHPEYKPSIKEIHHIQKKDAPSGTALSMIQGITEENPSIKGWSGQSGTDNSIIPVTSIREGTVSGIHEIRYVSPDDLILLRHEAFSRRGFALGAILAAEFMTGRKGIYSMSDLLGI